MFVTGMLTLVIECALTPATAFVLAVTAHVRSPGDGSPRGPVSSCKSSSMYKYGSHDDTESLISHCAAHKGLALHLERKTKKHLGITDDACAAFQRCSSRSFRAFCCFTHAKEKQREPERGENYRGKLVLCCRQKVPVFP